tara:strand:+ start:808 stop:1317 length:510 start_codon:yes stop_codon:yes gene_type:complete
MSCIGGDLNDNGVGVNAVSNAGVTDPVAGRVGYPVLCTLVINVKDRVFTVSKTTNLAYGFNSTIGSYGTIASGQLQLGNGRTVARANRLPTLNTLEENITADTLGFAYSNSSDIAAWNSLKVTNESAATFTVIRTAASFGSNTFTYSSFTNEVIKDANDATITAQVRAD